MADILIIDDSQFLCNLLRLILQSEGYYVCGEADNADEGFEKYKELKPDLVFCDIVMHETSGIGCLSSIMNYDPEAKVIICTSFGDKFHVEEAVAAGAKAIVLKPVKTAEILSVTERYLGKPKNDSAGYYKRLMESRAALEGVDGKPLLDFFEAFNKMSGIYFDDKTVDEKYLKKNTEQIIVGTRALMRPKESSSKDTDKIMNILRDLTKKKNYT